MMATNRKCDLSTKINILKQVDEKVPRKDIARTFEISVSAIKKIVKNKDKIEREFHLLSGKRIGYLEWQDYFMAVAFLSAQRSKDPRTQVGACIVNKEKIIVGTGYNGMPIGCSDDVMPWGRAQNDSPEEWLDSKAPYGHAELNAVLNKNLASIKGCSIYVSLFPCNACAQIIIQSGISEVVYYSDKKHNQKEFRASRRMLGTAGVTYRQYKPCQKKLIIDFESIEETPGDISLYPVVNRSGSNSEDTSVNNNSSGIRSMRLENHAEQQQLQNADQQEAQDPLQQVLQLVPSATTQLNNTFEVSYAFISLLVIGLMVIFMYLILLMICVLFVHNTRCIEKFCHPLEYSE